MECLHGAKIPQGIYYYYVDVARVTQFGEDVSVLQLCTVVS
jgi:hypothetical protein